MEHFFSNWTSLDYVLAIVFLISVVLSFFRGFVREIISVLTWFFAFYLALKFAPAVSGLLHSVVVNPKLSYGIAFAIIFIIVHIIGKLICVMSQGIMKVTFLGMFDKVLGFVFGVVRGVLLITIILVVIHMTHYDNAVWMQQSVIAPHFQKAVAHFTVLFPKDLFNLSLIKTGIITV